MTLKLIPCLLRRQNISNYTHVFQYFKENSLRFSLSSCAQRDTLLHSPSTLAGINKYFKSEALTKLQNDLGKRPFEFDNKYFEDLVEKMKGENSRFIDSSIMAALSEANELAVARKFLQYASDSKGSIGVYARVLYIRLLAANNTDHQFDEQIYSEYQSCVAKHGHLFDRSCLQKLSEAFATTHEWKKCLEFIELIKLNYALSFVNYQPLLHAALENGEMEFFSKYFATAYESKTKPSELGGSNSLIQETMMKYVELCSQNPVKVPISHLITSLEKLYIYPNEQVADGIAQCMKRDYKCGVSKTTLNHRGYCKNCGKTLKQNDITEEEFYKLKEEFYKVNIRDRDHFVWTTPEEIEQFQKFFSEHGPFDLVIDYLNLIYKDKKVMLKKEMAHDVLDYFADQGIKVLLISKNRIPSKYKNAKTFNVGRQTHDDVFLLYAAFQSGINTMVMSGDYYRDSKYILNDQCAQIFTRWQRSRQIKLVNFKKGSFMALKPKVYDPRTQKDGGVLHIPVKKEDIFLPTYDTPSSYLCVQFEE